MRQRQANGFTLSEVLIGMAILAVLLLAISQYFTSSLSSYRRATEMLERVQLESIARNVVVKELSFAGYGQGLFGDFSGPTIEIGVSGREDRSDTFKVHYLEEQWLSAPVQRHVTIDVTRDASGTWNLYRREEGATRQPAVQDVTNLKLIALVALDGSLLLPHEAWPDEIAAFIVLLSFGWETSRTAYIGFSAPQRLGRL